MPSPTLGLASPDAVPAGPAPDAAAPSFRQWGVLTLAVTAQTAGSVVSQGIYTLVPFFRDEFGLTQATAALAVTVMNAGQILSMFTLGRLIDRHGERAVVALTMVGMGLAALAGSYIATAYWMLLAFFTLLGIFYAAVQPGGTKAILRWFPPQHRGLATGFRQAAVPLGTSIAAFLLPIAAASGGWRTAVAVQGLIGVAGGVFFFAFYREGDLATGKKAPSIPARDLFRILGKDKAFWPVLGGGIAMSAFQFTFTASAISYMAASFRLSLIAAASLFAVVQIVGIPGRILLPMIVDRVWPGRRERCFGWVMAVTVVVTLVYAVLPPSAPQWLLYGILGLLGLFGIGWFPLYILQIAEIAPKAAIASTVSAATTFCMVAMSLVPFLFGAVVDAAGYRVAWGLLILPVAMLVLPLVRLPAREI